GPALDSVLRQHTVGALIDRPSELIWFPYTTLCRSEGDGGAGSLRRALIRGHGAEGRGRRRRDRKIRELVALVGVGEVAAAAHPGGGLVTRVDDSERPAAGGGRGPVLKQRQGGAVVD